jgi:IS30 family transposase
VTFNRPEMAYKASCAHRSAVRVRARPRRAKLAVRSRLRRVVLRWLRRRWSPQQIAARLRVEFPDRPEMRVSHETIYQAIYLQARGNLRAELARQVALRSGRAARRPRPAAGGAVRSNRAWLGLHISARPAEAADRAVPGHWEGDLVIGKDGAPRRSRPWWNGPPGSSCWSRCPRGASASTSSANSRPRWPICPSGFAGR